MLTKTALALAVSALIPTAALAQETQPSPFDDALSSAILPVKADAEGQLAGPGWKRLLREGNTAQFFLIGETHAVADIADAITQLHAGLAGQDYHYMVVELGPWSTRKAEALIRDPDASLGEYISTPGQQFVLPFLFFAEETALVEQAVALSRHEQDVLWGVDQEFLGAGPVLLELLERAAATPAQEQAVAAYAQGVGTNPMHTGTAPQQQIDALVAAFADADDATRKLTEGIALTHRVYGPFMRGTGPIFPANLERENYMKTNFLAHFRAAEARDGAPPKAVFKFGGYHMERGLSGTNVPALGNFIVEWGRSRGFDAVNLMVDCRSGEAYAIMKGGPDTCKPYALDRDSPLLAAVGEDKLALIDLKSLRPHLNRARDLDPKTRDLILSFDYYLTIRDVKPQTPLADLTLPGQ
ncbi:MAG: hypothetical protein QNJ15_11935 [Erythrobacter sp.]|nr:hypothetical protein [Erythrobacter sp.]